MQAYDQYFGTVADYNRAQFELFHALGYPARKSRPFGPLATLTDRDASHLACLRSTRALPGEPARPQSRRHDLNL